MRNNITALQHPTIKRKIRHAAWLAKLEAMQKHKAGHSFARGTQYIANRKGHNIMRLDYCLDHNKVPAMVVWGDCSRNITALVLGALHA